MTKAKLERLEKIVGRKDNIPLILWPDDNGLYEYNGKKYTAEAIKKLDKSFILVQWV